MIKVVHATVQLTVNEVLCNAVAKSKWKGKTNKQNIPNMPQLCQQQPKKNK